MTAIHSCTLNISDIVRSGIRMYSILRIPLAKCVIAPPRKCVCLCVYRMGQGHYLLRIVCHGNGGGGSFARRIVRTGRSSSVPLVCFSIWSPINLTEEEEEEAFRLRHVAPPPSGSHNSNVALYSICRRFGICNGESKASGTMRAA